MHRLLRVLLILVLVSLMVAGASAQEGGILIGTNFGGIRRLLIPCLPITQLIWLW